MAGPETFEKYKTPIYLAGSASAEFFADIGLCAFEAVKVHGACNLCCLPCTALPVSAARSVLLRWTRAVELGTGRHAPSASAVAHGTLSARGGG